MTAQQTLHSPSRVQRLAVALFVGLASGAFNAWIIRPDGPNHGHNDFFVYWLAGKALLNGVDPYVYTPAHYSVGLFAPATIGLIAAPFTWMPQYIGASVFFAIGSGLLAFAITNEGWYRLLVFATVPIWRAVLIAQVTPLLVGAAFYPLGWGLLTAKPNVALPLLAMQAKRRTIVSGATSIVAVLLVSLAVRPTWPLGWYRSLADNPFGAQYRVPLFTVWGPLLCLPLLRWRRPEARLVFVMALMPQNYIFYEQLPLALAAQSRRELIFFAIISQVVGEISNLAHRPGLSFLEWNAVAMPYVIIGMYLPAVVCVLRRPNQSASHDDASLLAA